MDERQVVLPQVKPARTRWAVAVAVFMVATFGYLWLDKRACEGTGNEWFWLPVRTADKTYWGCEITDE